MRLLLSLEKLRASEFHWYCINLTSDRKAELENLPELNVLFSKWENKIPGCVYRGWKLNSFMCLELN